MNLSILDIYEIIKRAVMHYPASSPVKVCAQPQTFRVLARDPRSNAEIGTDTLGAVISDKGAPFFWSRQWDLKEKAPGNLSYGYPIVLVFEIINHVKNGMKSKSTRDYVLEIAVLDVYRPDQCNNPKINSCAGRPINQIYLDTESILDGILNYIGNIVSATTNDDPVEKIYHQEFLNQNYAGQHVVKIRHGDIFSAKNQRLSMARVEYSAKNIYGTKTQIELPSLECGTVEFDFNQQYLTDAIGFEAGCKNCY